MKRMRETVKKLVRDWRFYAWITGICFAIFFVMLNYRKMLVLFAPLIMKIAGVGAVFAKSFARIFYRNAINIGLLVIECDTDKIDAGDELELDIKNGVLKDITKNIELEIMPLPDVMIKLLADGGLVEHIKKHGDFKIV